MNEQADDDGLIPDDEERLEVHRTIDPSMVSVPFLRQLQEVYWRVALGLNGADTSTAESLQLPSVVSFKPAADFAESLEYSKDDFKKWIITNGLRDCAEALQAHLEVLFSQCLLMKYASETGKIASETYEGEYASKRKAFHKMNIDKRLEELKNEFDIEFRDTTLRCLRSLNKVRNCLAHRGGFVQKPDCNAGEQLKVEWLAMVPIRRDGTEIKFGEPLNDTEIWCRNEIRVRIFEQQTYIDFTSRDFAEFLMNYTFFGKETVKYSLSYAKSTGLLK